MDAMVKQFSLDDLGPFPDSPLDGWFEPPADAWPELPHSEFQVGIDESGDGSACIGHYLTSPLLVLAGAYVEATRIGEFERALNTLKAEAFAKYFCTNRLPELHTAPMLRGTGAFQRVPIRERCKFLADALRLADQQGVRFIVSGVHNLGVLPQLENGAWIYERVFKDMLTSIAQVAECKSSALPISTFQVLADSRPEGEADRLSCFVNHMHDHDVPLPRREDLTLRYLGRDVEFVDSCSSALVQLADLVAFTTCRRVKRTLGMVAQTPIDESATSYQDLIPPMITADQVWFPFDNVTIPSTVVSKAELPRTVASHAVTKCIVRGLERNGRLATRSMRRHASRRLTTNLESLLPTALAPRV